MALSREQRADISSAAHAMRSALLVLLTGGERVPLPTESLEASLSELDKNILDDAYHLGRNVVERVREIETCDAPAPELIASALDAVSAFESHLNPLAIGEEALVEDVDLLIDESFDRMLVFDPVIDSADPVQDGGFEIDDELREVFAEEAESLLTSMGDHLDKLAVDPKDKEALWEIRRNAHTLKGSAGIVGLAAASEMAHRIEDLLDSLAESDAAPPPQIIPALLTATECLRAMAAGDTSVRVGEVRDHLFKEFDKLLALSGPAAVETPGSQSIGELETDASSHAARSRGNTTRICEGLSVYRWSCSTNCSASQGMEHRSAPFSNSGCRCSTARSMKFITWLDGCSRSATGWIRISSCLFFLRTEHPPPQGTLRSPRRLLQRTTSTP
jgi:HPt (histidine-containing phosphotransfer) domain-containing protein